jgi:cysteine synthase A
MRIANDVTELIGNTPLVRIRRLAKGSTAQDWPSSSSTIPAHSVKDRIGLAMIEAAERPARSAPTPSSSNPPAATPASRWRWCARRAATAAAWSCPKP